MSENHILMMALELVAAGALLVPGRLPHGSTTAMEDVERRLSCGRQVPVNITTKAVVDGR